jgi:ribonuclease P protein component|tara:strand:- start:194 stop:568 length:375 start_codon:yes stop_codon:yes gene_type:complete
LSKVKKLVGRLKKRSEFINVTANGKKWVTRGFILVANAQREKSTPDLEYLPRVGFTATKKIGNSVVRNKAKRILRAISQEVLTSSNTPAWDYVIIARKTLTTSNYEDLKKDFRWAIKKLEAKIV